MKSRFYITLSSIFEKQGSTEIDLQFPISFTSSTLYIGVTGANLSSSGKQPFWRDSLKIAIDGYSKGPKQFLTTLKLMSS